MKQNLVVLIVAFVFCTVFSPVFAQMADAAAGPADTPTAAAPSTSGTGDPATIEVDDDNDPGQAEPTGSAAAAPAAVAAAKAKPDAYAPCVVRVNIDGKPAEDGVVILRDQVEKDTIIRLGISDGSERTTLQKDHHYTVQYVSGPLKFQADHPVWLGEKVDSAKIIINYNSKTKKWAFSWDKFGDTERCSLYFLVRRANDKPVPGYRLTLIREPHRVVMQDVELGKDGKLNHFLPKPEKGEGVDKYFALLVSNFGPDLRYRFRVGPESLRVRQEFMIRARNGKKVEPPIGKPPAVEPQKMPPASAAVPADGNM